MTPHVDLGPDRPALDAVTVLASILGDVQAKAALAALSSAGLVCVPREPTKVMLDEAWASAEAERADLVWRDMVEVAERNST